MWTLQQKLVATPATEPDGAGVGWSVALADNGDTALLGGPLAGSDDGAVWAFSFNPLSVPVWTQAQKLPAPSDGTTGAEFGWSIAMTGNGTGITAVIGGPHDDSADTGGTAGEAWIYNDAAGAASWAQVGSGGLIPSNEIGDGNFGWSVSISDDASTVLVGAPQDNGNKGAAWTFVFVAGVGWVQGSTIHANDESSQGYFGWGVALSGDTTASPRSGSAVIGGPADVGPTSAGAIWRFEANSDGWFQENSALRPSDSTGGALFGYGVALSSDGNTALVGGPFDSDNSSEGAVWVFVPGAGVGGESAIGLDDVSGEIFGFVDPDGQDTTYHVEYGPTVDYGQTTPDRNAPATGGTASVDETVDSLQPNTTYHYRIVATSAAGTAFGPDQTFTTGLQVNGTAGVQLTGAIVNGVLGGCPSQDTPQIDWGDGTPLDTTSGSVTNCHPVPPDSEGFTIVGSHTYQAPGHYTVTATLPPDNFTGTGGAQVFAAGQTLTVTTTADTLDDGNCLPAFCTLRQAVEAANAGDGTYTISVPFGVYQLSGSFGALTVDNGMTILGDGARITTIIGEAAPDPSEDGDRVFDLTSNADPVTIDGVTLAGGAANANNNFFGGDVRSAGNLTLSDDTISGGFACSGGGISNFGGTMLVDRTTVVRQHGRLRRRRLGRDPELGEQRRRRVRRPSRSGTARSPATRPSNGGGVFSWGNTVEHVSIEDSTIADNTSTGPRRRHPRHRGDGLGRPVDRLGQHRRRRPEQLQRPERRDDHVEREQPRERDRLRLHRHRRHPGHRPAARPGAGQRRPDGHARRSRRRARPSTPCRASARRRTPTSAGSRGRRAARATWARSSSRSPRRRTTTSRTRSTSAAAPRARRPARTSARPSRTASRRPSARTRSRPARPSGGSGRRRAPACSSSTRRAATSTPCSGSSPGARSRSRWWRRTTTSAPTRISRAASASTRPPASRTPSRSGATPARTAARSTSTGARPRRTTTSRTPLRSRGSRARSTPRRSARRSRATSRTATGSSDNSVWYAWTAPTDGPVTFESASTFGEALDVFTGSAVDSLTPVAGDLDGNDLTVPFQAAAGTTYYVRVATYDALPGTFTLSWNQIGSPTIVDPERADGRGHGGDRRRLDQPGRPADELLRPVRPDHELRPADGTAPARLRHDRAGRDREPHRARAGDDVPLPLRRDERPRDDERARPHVHDRRDGDTAAAAAPGDAADDRRPGRARDLGHARRP